MSITDWISIGSFLLVAAGYIWGGIFRFSGLEHKVNALADKIDTLANNMQRLEEKIDVRFEKMENKIESVRLDLHKIDIRVTKLEQANQKN